MPIHFRIEFKHMLLCLCLAMMSPSLSDAYCDGHPLAKDRPRIKALHHEEQLEWNRVADREEKSWRLKAPSPRLLAIYIELDKLLRYTEDEIASCNTRYVPERWQAFYRRQAVPKSNQLIVKARDDELKALIAKGDDESRDLLFDKLWKEASDIKAVKKKQLADEQKAAGTGYVGFGADTRHLIALPWTLNTKNGGSAAKKKSG